MRTVLIANRGEIACRIIRTVKAMGLRAVAVYSDADRHAAHVKQADAAVRLGPAPAAESYLRIEAILAACAAEGVDAVHPGYGFLSESAAFAEALAAQGIVFVGPTPEHLRLFGVKHTAREVAERAGVPLLPGSGLVADLSQAQEAAERIGYPLMLKSTAGGGGIGLQLCRSAEELPAHCHRVSRAAGASFGDERLFLERFVATARHVEVQIFGDGQHVVALGERDCSLQRRNQKVIEETPAPSLSAATRDAVLNAAVRLGETVGYLSAGTVEFIYDPGADEAYFLEVNTRLQVEHPVTEAVLGIDLVAWMLRAAMGALDLSAETVRPRGHAIEARLYAEDPAGDFRPASGRITSLRLPDHARVDHWLEPGTIVPPHYDPLLAKIVATGPTRNAAIAALADALDGTEVHGVATNLDYLRDIARAPFLRDGRVSTDALARLWHRSRTVEVLSPGTQSTLQDLPGRIGLWHVGVPPSGPMDPRSHRLANRIVGNAEDAPALEMALSGPTLRFRADALVALTGADMGAVLDGEPVPRFEPVPVPAGATLVVGLAGGSGLRATLAVRGGFDAPVMLDSRSTFVLGGFGGHAEGPLRAGDVLRLGGQAAPHEPASAPPDAGPLTDNWTIGVLYGPHGAPDFFTEEDISALLASPYRVGANSARTGVRLEGPKPTFARPHGGEAGLHPSNIHDNAYVVGSVNFTGDMPIILGPDGPSLGGFVCPFVVARDELWKLGQLRPGDTVRFRALALAEARALAVDAGPVAAPRTARVADLEDAVRLRRPDRPIPVAYRRSGQNALLVEFGDNVLDLSLRVRAHALMERLADAGIAGITEVTPGIRSLQLAYDDGVLSEAKLLEVVDEIERALPAPEDTVVPSRIVRLPLAFDDSQTRLATERYRTNVRPDAPWCPSNIEFIRRINGLDSVEAVRDTVYAADYLVYGLGDVYLGAPVATPLDPRHRLVTTKYNPARTWTPQNAVGIGGAYLCIYGMEGPGGYQLVGRTVQVWSTFAQKRPFREGVPWLLRYFDRIRFYPVDEAELFEMREGFLHGEVEIAVEDGVLSVAEEHRRLADAADEIAAFERRRSAAFADERAAWREMGLAAAPQPPPPATPSAFEHGRSTIAATLAGVVWSIAVGEGQRIEVGDTVAVLEAMKMEVPLAATRSGRVKEVLVSRQQMVNAGDPILTLHDE